MNKKIRNIFLTLGASSLAAPILFASANCGGTKKPNNPNIPDEPKKQISDEEFNNIVKSLNQNDFDFNFKAPNPLSRASKNQILATDIFDDESNIELTLKNQNYKDKINLKFFKSNLIGNEDDNLPKRRSKANQNGEIEFVVQISAKGKKTVNKVIKITGLMKNNGMNRNGQFNQDPTDFSKPQKSELKKYVQDLNQLERYKLDNPKYIEALAKQFSYSLNQEIKENDYHKVRKDLSQLKSEVIEKFNKLAEKNNFDSYASAALKGFTLPTYDTNGQYLGMSLDENPEVGKGPSWVDALGRDNPYKIDGLARTLPNEMYKKAALQTYQLTINNDDKDDPQKGTTSAGTMWLMDYQKRNDGKYPTKFYFGTNLHVADLLSDLTSSFSMLRLNKNTGIKTTLMLSDLDKHFQRFIFGLNKALKEKKGIRTVFNGRDFLNSKPADYLSGTQKTKFNDFEEFVDFSVFEIDFEEIFKTSTNKYNMSSAEDLAKLVTNDYADDKDNHVRFKSESYLKNYNKINAPLALKSKNDKLEDYDHLYAVGYPSSLYDHFLRRYTDDHQSEQAKWNYSLWLNSNYMYFDQLSTQEGMQPSYSDDELSRGNFLSYQLGYRSFINRPGVLDAFIAAPKNGTDWYKSSDGKQYINMGLEYLPKHFAPGGGASGSSVRNQKNELVGVYHVSNNSAKTGLAAAFRSEGYDYGELFGNKYKLPQYDLIYGGGQDQKNSYRQALKELYKNDSNFRTALFENGFEEANIPAEYKFNGYVKDTN